MTRKRGITLIIFALLAALFVSCSSTEALDMIDQLRTEQDQKIEALSGQVGQQQENITAIEKEITQLSKEISDLKASLSGVEKDLEFTYSTINEFVSYAGYESGDDFLSLGRDIVGVTTQIDAFNARIDALQELMRDFLEK